jgi:hypothetical protein
MYTYLELCPARLNSDSRNKCLPPSLAVRTCRQLAPHVAVRVVERLRWIVAITSCCVVPIMLQPMCLACMDTAETARACRVDAAGDGDARDDAAVDAEGQRVVSVLSHCSLVWRVAACCACCVLYATV